MNCGVKEYKVYYVYSSTFSRCGIMGITSIYLQVTKYMVLI